MLIGHIYNTGKTGNSQLYYIYKSYILIPLGIRALPNSFTIYLYIYDGSILVFNSSVLFNYLFKGGIHYLSDV